MKNRFQKTISTFLPALFLVLSMMISSASIGQTDSPVPIKTGYAPVNGLKMYYEVYGSGRPLLLLHGAFMTIHSNWDAMIPALSKTHKVIAVEMQAHGRTPDIDRPFSFESMADDAAALLTYMNADSADVIGYSMGGGVAQQLAIRHPEKVRKVVLLSCVYKFEGWYPEGQAAFHTMKAEMFDGSPLQTEYNRVASDPNQWLPFVNKMLYWISKPYDFGADNFKAIQAPRLIIIGDSDGVQPEHAVEMFRLAGGGMFGDFGTMPASQLAIAPATTHVGIMFQTEWLLKIIEPFLKM
ncbi:MAG TPA: alpha/beta hydrolase [Saprospiraceae bacterium]|nr:alpha/beta hydrolase [Saprospiraceae bacterium]